MGLDTQTVGGEAQSGSFGSGWEYFLKQLISPNSGGQIMSGGMGNQPDPVGRTSDIMANIRNLVAGIDLTGAKDSARSLIQQDTARGAANLRESFTAAGGGGLGTPEAVASARFQAEAVPKGAMALTELDFQNRNQQMAILAQLFSVFNSLGNRQTPQAETIASPSPWMAALSALGSMGQSAASIYKDTRTGRT